MYVYAQCFLPIIRMFPYTLMAHVRTLHMIHTLRYSPSRDPTPPTRPPTPKYLQPSMAAWVGLRDAKLETQNWKLVTSYSFPGTAAAAAVGGSVALHTAIADLVLVHVHVHFTVSVAVAVHGCHPESNLSGVRINVLGTYYYRYIQCFAQSFIHPAILGNSYTSTCLCLCLLLLLPSRTKQQMYICGIECSFVHRSVPRALS